MLDCRDSRIRLDPNGLFAYYPNCSKRGPESTGPRSRKGLFAMLRKLFGILAVVALVALATLATAVRTVTPSPVPSDLAVALASE